MANVFEGIQEKLIRTNEIIRNLDAEITSFFQERDYPSLPEHDRELLLKAIQYHKNLPIPPRFSVLAGEVIHHLRSCLDHLAGMVCAELECLLTREETRHWRVHLQAFDGKAHFLRYAGRYVRRPPTAQRRILSVAHGLVRFWYKDKRLRRQETVQCTVEEFIDRWAQHIPNRYRHAARQFGLFAPRRWARAAAAVFTIIGQKLRPRPRRRPWAIAIEQQFGRNPLLDSMGGPMTWVRHLAPAPT